MSELLVNDASTISSAAMPQTNQSADGLETLIDQLSATLQRSEVDGVSSPHQSQMTAQSLESLFVFGLAGARYGVPMSHVLEVQRMPTWTKLPNVAAWALGAANLRGDIVSVIDVRKFLNLPDNAAAAERMQKLLVLRSHQQDLQIGLAVDRVFGLRHVSRDSIKSPTGRIHETVVTYLTGACEIDSQMVLVLDSEQLLKTLATPFAAAT